MKHNLLLISLLLASLSLTSCEALGGIFKAGMWMGVIVVVLVIAIVLWLIRKMRK
jgi:predicted small secreted protein